jgi:hypothetical protein
LVVLRCHEESISTGKLFASIAHGSLQRDGGENLAKYAVAGENKEGKTAMQTTELKRAIAWGAGLGLGFALAGMALGVFRRIR